MNQTSSRIEWIDILKGIGICFVTFGHLYPALPIEKHIYSFHMFLFFFISGYLYKHPGSFQKQIKKKVVSLLVPFLCWDIFATIIDIFVNKNYADAISRAFTIGGGLCWDRPIWFLLVLFFVEIIFTLIDKLPSPCLYGAMAVAFIAGYFTQGTSVTLKLTLIPVAYFYYSVGVVSRKFNIPAAFNNRWFLILPCTLAVNIVFGVILNYRLSMVAADYGNYLYCLIAGITGIAFYLTLSNKISKLRISTVFSFLGQNTMFIMCAQYGIFYTYNFLFRFDVWHTRGTLKAFALAVVTIALICLIRAIVKKSWIKRLAKAIGINVG